MLNKTELNILKLLASRESINWTWYNLDRAMTSKKMEGTGNVARFVDNLSKAGLVDIIPSGNPSGMHYYRVSESGHLYLKHIRDDPL
ncbi:hypothetical protein KXR87_18185 [Yokenella regensburgei]|uniref:hypothetical protein n=1 Tax=Yokenella regensburgei TaxID=158877 RepID=UPI003F188950